MLFKFKKIITQLVLISAIIEITFFFSIEILWATFILVFGWIIIKDFVLTQKNLKQYPITFFMFFGVALFHYAFPIPLTLLELKPVNYNLQCSNLTFLHHGLIILILVITHFIYRQSSLKFNPFREILKKTSFYKIVDDKLIWITSILALIFSIYIYLIFGVWENFTKKNFFITLFQPISIFLWMPVIIPFYKVRNIESKLSFKTKIFIILYSIIVIIISIISNWRTMLFSGIILFICMFLVGLLLGKYSIKSKLNSKNISLIIILILLILGPIIDLGIAMIITRQTRYETNSSKFLENTIQVYQNKELLKKVKNQFGENSKSYYSIKRWNEDYLENYFFNRYSNLKISDNCIYYAQKIGYNNLEMKKILKEELISFIPSFITAYLNLESNLRKEEHQSSITDNLYSLSIKNDSVKGSSIIGSLPGVGLSIFGYWYLIVIIPIFYIIFFMFDSYAFIVNNKVFFSYYFFTIIVLTFNFFNDRHVFNFELRWILRNYFESIIFFLLFTSVSRFILKIFYSKQR